MGQWEAVALADVRAETVRRALANKGVVWSQAAHVTATTTLAKAIRDGEQGQVALPIATLIDAIVLPGTPGRSEVEISGLPTPLDFRSRSEYLKKMSAWQDRATGLRIQQYLMLEDRLRSFCRENADHNQFRVLTSSRREFTRTIVTMSAAGIHPTELDPADPIAALAVKAWAEIELHVPGLTATRDDLWMSPEVFRAQTSGRARHLGDRINAALRHLFPVTASGRVQILHHGFYFFTPPQWALFQLLRELPFVDQIFIVHDDQKSEVFETWRKFFNTSWQMPRPAPLDGSQVGSQPAKPAMAFTRALGGSHIEGAEFASSLRILECASPTELVRELRSDAIGDPESAGQLFAAQASDVERFLRRLGTTGDGSAVDLAQLPVGVFLLALHRCIRPMPSAAPEIVLNRDDVLDMAGSGFLSADDTSADELVSALRRALPFFQGCVDVGAWTDRAAALRSLVVAEVDPRGGRSTTSTDVERWKRLVGNPLRLVPWGDLTIDEAALVEGAIKRVAELAQEVASRERVSLRRHVRFLTQQLERGMKEVPEDDQAKIREKLRGMSAGPDLDLDPDGLVDVVAMLLGRRVDFEDDGAPDTTGVPEMRALDALGFRRASTDVHVTNLSASSFPGRGSVVGWPLRIDDLRASKTIAPITLDILEARSQLGAFGDLYLFWLALDGVEANRRLTLSWMAKVGSEPQNPSPLLNLLAIPETPSPEIRALAGGLDVATAQPGSDLPPLTARPSPLVEPFDQSDLNEAIATIPAEVIASAVVCPRRFALQWALGPTASFQADHHQTMLYGNVRNALVRMKVAVNVIAASSLANKLWPHLTTGQRASALDRARIRPQGSSSDPQWLFTLSGSKDVSRTPFDSAYNAARKKTLPNASVVGPAEGDFLPDGVADAAVCRLCPVRDRCSQNALD